MTVSVIIPSVGRSSLDAAINSALEQSMQPLEVLVVLNNCKQVDSQFMSHPRVKFINDPNVKNGNQARNMGVRLAQGTYVAFLDDDDVFLPNKLESQISYINSLSNSKALITTSFYYNLPEGNYYPREVYRNNQSISRYLFFRTSLRNSHKALPSITWLAPRSLFQEIQFDDDLLGHQDWEWLLRAEFLYKVQIYQMDSPLVVITQNSTDNTKSRFSEFDTLEWFKSNQLYFDNQTSISFILNVVHSRFLDSNNLIGALKLIKYINIYGLPSVSTGTIFLLRQSIATIKFMSSRVLRIK